MTLHPQSDFSLLRTLCLIASACSKATRLVIRFTVADQVELFG